MLSQTEARAQNWPGLEKAGFKTIDAAYNVENGTVTFFRGSEYVIYDAKADKVTAGPFSLGDGMPSLKGTGFDKGIDAAVNWSDGRGTSSAVTNTWHLTQRPLNWSQATPSSSPTAGKA